MLLRIRFWGQACEDSHFGRSARPGARTPGSGYGPVGGARRGAHLAMEMVADSRKMLAFELVEINPIIDVMNKTAILGVGLVSSALGKKIL
ncbi:MAG: arginase family protein [Terriglobia bacterium]